MKNMQPESNTETSLHESYLILVSWIVFCGWTLFWTATQGFHSDDGDAVAMAFGMPAWVTWGVALPWLVATAFTTWFCLSFMKDDEIVDSESGDTDG